MDYKTLTQQSRLNAAAEAEEMQLFALLKPTLTQDGDQFCVLYGDNLQTGIGGFGDTPRKAIRAFNKAWDKPALLPNNAMAAQWAPLLEDL